jgi:predicted permease
MPTLAHDLRLAVRRLRLQPGFAALAILTLALGLGANTAIFSLIRGTILQDLPVPRPSELVRLGDTDDCCVNSGMPDTWSLFSYPLFEHLRANLPQFQSLAAFQAAAPTLGVRRAGTDTTESLPSEFVTGNFFSTFEVAPALGRLFAPQDDVAGAEPVFVMSHRAWTQKFGGDPAVIGSAFLVAGKTMTLAGVAAESFFGASVRPEPAAVWIPLAQEPFLRGPTSILHREPTNWLYAIGRLRPGVELTEVSTAATELVRRWLAADPGVRADGSEEDIPRQTLFAVSAPGGVNRLRFGFARPLVVLFITAAAVLLIAAANLANLLLARADVGRVALQSALGAPASLLVRQALVEGILLAAAGAILGLGVAAVAMRALLALAFPPGAYVPVAVSSFSPSVLGFSFVLALLTGAGFSALPAWTMARSRSFDALRGSGRSAGGGVAARSFVPRRALVIVQVALSVVLIAGAGLLGQSLRRIERQPLGFATDGRVVARIRLPAPPTDPARLAPLYDSIRARLGEIPGVEQVSYALYSPLQGDNWSSEVAIEGRPADETTDDNSSWNRVGPDYFETLGTRILLGRGITERDVPGAARVAVVNQAFVRKFFPDSSPLGARLGFGGAERASDFEIVGVSEDVKYTQAQEPTRPMVFFPVLQHAEGLSPSQMNMTLRSMGMNAVLLRVRGGAAANLEIPIRRAFAEIDPDLAVQRVVPLADQVSANFQIQRLLARLTSGYGLLALGLAALGLYAVTAHGVARRTRDFGVRMALGADAARVVREVLRGALGQAAAGLVLGTVAALFVTRYAATLLYDIGARDPGTLGATALGLLVTAALAALVPALRAARVEPARALRAE